jgi:ABC-type multidrug transport system ATPase subunit
MLDRLGNRMSGGEQQMLTVARTLIGNPLLVLLDEPSEGVAPLIVEQIANTIVELKKEGRRFCCRSRTSTSRNWCRIESMCSRKAKSSCRARWHNLRTTWTCSEPI